MDERTRRLVEAALDPRGKFYGRPSPPANSADLPEVERLRDDTPPPIAAGPRPSGLPAAPGEGPASWDEWEPA